MDHVNRYYRAINLNNDGVSLIETCQYDRAIPSLLSAMEIIKGELAADKSSATNSSSSGDPFDKRHHHYHDSSTTSSLSSSTAMEEDMSDECALHSTECDFRETTLPDFLVNLPTSSEQQRRFVFRFPIKARPCHTYCFVKLSIITLYNLALAFHLSAIESSNQNKLYKALMLYECTYQVQVEEHVELSFVHPLAILNNVGQIHALLDHQDQARLSFRHLLSIMLCFIDQFGCADETHEAWDGFLSNVMELILKNPSPAAAA